jgi:hypothetical protein
MLYKCCCSTIIASYCVFTVTINFDVNNLFTNNFCTFDPLCYIAVLVCYSGFNSIRYAPKNLVCKLINFRSVYNHCSKKLYVSLSRFKCCTYHYVDCVALLFCIRDAMIFYKIYSLAILFFAETRETWRPVSRQHQVSHNEGHGWRRLGTNHRQQVQKRLCAVHQEVKR